MTALYCETRGVIHYLQDQHSKAVTSFDMALQINPSHIQARIWLIAALTQIGEHDKAQWQVIELAMSGSNLSLDNIKLAFPFWDQSLQSRLMQILRQAGLPG